MRRWLLLALGLLAVGVGAWVWLSPPKEHAEEIGPASRSKMERLLQENP